MEIMMAYIPYHAIPSVKYQKLCETITVYSNRSLLRHLTFNHNFSVLVTINQTFSLKYILRVLMFI